VHVCACVCVCVCVCAREQSSSKLHLLTLSINYVVATVLAYLTVNGVSWTTISKLYSTNHSVQPSDTVLAVSSALHRLTMTKFKIQVIIIIMLKM